MRTALTRHVPASLRGAGALLLSAEYRYPIWDTWNAYLFWDEGQIFDEYGDIETDGFRTSYGAGISLRTEQAFLIGLSLAHSADQGLQIEKIQQRLATMEGEIAELRHESSGTSKAQAERSLELQRRLSEVARAAGMDVPIDADQVPKSKSAHWEALTKAYRINKYSYTRGLARAYVER